MMFRVLLSALFGLLFWISPQVRATEQDDPAECLLVGDRNTRSLRPGRVTTIRWHIKHSLRRQSSSSLLNFRSIFLAFLFSRRLETRMRTAGTTKSSQPGRFLRCSPALGCDCPAQHWKQPRFRRASLAVATTARSSLRLPSIALLFSTVSFSRTSMRMHAGRLRIPRAWLAAMLDIASRSQEKVRLVMHIPVGINDYNTVKDEEAGSGPVEFWLPCYSRQFIKLVDKFKDTIQIVFSGHTHIDDFRVIEAGRTGLVVNKLVPSISPIFKNNPGFQVYQYDRGSGAVHNYRTISRIYPQRESRPSLSK
jgi:hypothetical protein